ncbi:hypothetical protein SLEP1_g12989 [Rubroshorea leprosula]|uniref:Uncharacterized protein n=1 Tax=Rubroshorea leprosula TaxID=152421 RepID=A0AAV5IEC3_9ROSI|nr:hypothetical protein SLEP1_g12989 [Rubroshorea leprosula]
MAAAGHNNLNAKLVLLGDMGAGKSSLVLRFVKGQFLEFQESTIGAAFFSQTVAVNDSTVKFEIWDTAGQERYHSLAPMYYRGAAAGIIVYDITSTESFARAKKWVQELQKQGVHLFLRNNMIIKEGDMFLHFIFMSSFYLIHFLPTCYPFSH